MVPLPIDLPQLLGTGLPGDKGGVQRQLLGPSLHAELHDVARGVRRLGLFGSFVREAAGPESDIDFLVDFDPSKKSFDNLLALGDLLEAALGRRVEIVTTAGLSPFVGPHILKEAEDVLRAA